MESQKERELERQNVMVTLLATPAEARGVLIKEYRVATEISLQKRGVGVGEQSLQKSGALGFIIDVIIRASFVACLEQKQVPVVFGGASLV
jgi:hypothetical protein